MAMREEPLGRAFDPATSGQINQATKVPKPKILTKTEWGGGEASTTLLRSHFPVFITLHHTGDNKPLTREKDPKQHLRNIQQWGWRDKKWADLPYHYLIDLDGNIYEGRDPLKVGDTNTKYDPAGHFLISVIGNYMVQAPNENQLKAIADLFAYACDYYNISPATLRGHRDVVSGTSCPGKFLYPYVTSGMLEGEIRRRLQSAYGINAEDAPTTTPARTPSPAK